MHTADMRSINPDGLYKSTPIGVLVVLVGKETTLKRRKANEDMEYVLDTGALSSFPDGDSNNVKCGPLAQMGGFG